jgi:arylsulfatase A-like enzyme
MSGRRPNILLLLQDQLRWDLAADGGVATPGLDRLRAEGLTFEQAYTPTSICSPARASLFTGVYAHAHGVLNNITGPESISRDLPPDLPTTAELLRDAGYRTGHAGKWHVAVGGPSARGFEDDVAGDGMIGTEARFADYRERWGNPSATTLTTRYAEKSERAERFRPFRFPIYSTDPVDEHVTIAAAIAEAGEGLLRSYAADGRDDPFFLVISFVDPHWPMILPEPWGSMYDPASIKPWANFEDDFVGKPGTNRAALEHYGVADFTWDDWAPYVARYMGSITYTDMYVDRILGLVDELGLADDTLVLASADHGDMAGSHRQFNKGPLMYEETYRIPMVARWPGHVAPGSSTDGLVSLVDLTPTFVDVASGTVPDTFHGKSLVPVLEGETSAVRDALLCEFHADEFSLCSQRMIRRGSYKLVFNPNDVRELYDLSTDPAELHNLADDPAFEDLRHDLEAHLLELMEATQDPLLRMSINSLG